MRGGCRPGWGPGSTCHGARLLNQRCRARVVESGVGYEEMATQVRHARQGRSESLPGLDARGARPGESLRGARSLAEEATISRECRRRWRMKTRLPTSGRAFAPTSSSRSPSWLRPPGRGQGRCSRRGFTRVPTCGGFSSSQMTRSRGCQDARSRPAGRPRAQRCSPVREPHQWPFGILPTGAGRADVAPAGHDEDAPVYSSRIGANRRESKW
jgi:hypothetical protein